MPERRPPEVVLGGLLTFPFDSSLLSDLCTVFGDVMGFSEVPVLDGISLGTMDCCGV